MNRHEKLKQTTHVRASRHKRLFLEQLRKTPIVQIACDKTGAKRTTVYRWRDEDKNFAKEMERALDEGRSLINDAAEGQLMGSIRDRNLPAVIFWLKHHHPSYSTKIAVETTIKEVGFTPEQKILIEDAMRLAGLLKPKVPPQNTNDQPKPTTE